MDFVRERGISARFTIVIGVLSHLVLLYDPAVKRVIPESIRNACQARNEVAVHVYGCCLYP